MIRKRALLLLGAVCALGSLAFTKPASANVCITPEIYNLGGTHTKVLPFGCSFDGETPFSFTGVIDASNNSHTVKISNFEQFASLSGIGGVYISGFIDSTPFGDFAMESHSSDTLGNVLLPVPTTDYPATLLSESVSLAPNYALPDGLMLQLDPGQTSSGSYSVATGPLMNGVQFYQVTDIFSLYFQASLNGGTTWVSNDPSFGLATLDSNLPNYGLISSYIQTVPEPPSSALLATGLVMMGIIAVGFRAARSLNVNRREV